MNPRALRLLAAALVLANGLFPAAWILLTSFKTEDELMRTDGHLLPDALSLANYRDALTQQPLLLYLGNSVAVALLSCVVCLFVSALAAYALVRLPVPGRGLVLGFIIASGTFPLVTLLTPLFETMRAFDLLNSYTALVLPYSVLSLPVCTLVLISFFQTIPAELEQSAMVDGCTRLGALRRIVLPLAAPGVFTAGILAFVNAWDEFLLALSFNASPAWRTLPVGITLFQGQFAFPWSIISAALVIAIVPIVVVILVFQERVVSGLTAGGVKG